MGSHGGGRRYPAGAVFRMGARGTVLRALCAILKARDVPGPVFGSASARVPGQTSGRGHGAACALAAVLTHVQTLVLTMAIAAFPGIGIAATCIGTGTNETAPADVYEARMTAKAEDGAFDFSSGAMEAAKICADLINRLSNVTLSGVGVPTLEDVVEAVKDVLEETVEEACRYVANTTTNWVRSQTSYARQSANSTASNLVGARVNVSNPSASSVAATYRSRLRQKLPTYSDLPSLRDLQ